MADFRKNFLGVPGAETRPEKCRFTLTPVPYEKTTSYSKGTKRGPAAVVEASNQVELLDEELNRETWKLGISTLAAVNCAGAGAFKKVSAAAKKAAGYKAVPFFVGGEHSITQAILPAFLEKYGNLSVLHFDAHADLRETYEGSAQNHACALYPASKACRVVQVGIRNVAPEEAQNVNAGNVKTFLAHENREIKPLVKKVLAALTQKVYLTIDVDGFDPSVMPATGTPQPGGFGWYDGLELFRAVCSEKTVVGADVVEVSPRKGEVITEFAAAKLIYRLMGYISLK